MVYVLGLRDVETDIVCIDGEGLRKMMTVVVVVVGFVTGTS